MPDTRPILLVIGTLLVPLGLAMILPGLLDLVRGDADWRVFFSSAGLTLVFAITLILANRQKRPQLSVQQAFILTAGTWVALPAFAALPFVFGELRLSYTDAFFEAMSGLTTTGATIITGLDDLSYGVLLWRALLQWLGGIGIIVTAIAVLPMLQVGGMQLFRMESSDSSEKILPRATQLAGHIALVYLTLSVACAVLYFSAGMTPFDSIAHAMTTIATGGFSTHDASFAAFSNIRIELIAMGFMLLGSVPFVLYLQAARGKPGMFLKDDQLRWFIIIVTTAIIIMSLARIAQGVDSTGASVRAAAFNTVSIITGTGYANANYGDWGAFAAAFFFALMFVGGCAGSTSCGIKMFRFVVIARTLMRTLRGIIYPHGVFAARYNGIAIQTNVSVAVMNFAFLYILIWLIFAGALEALGLDTITALSASATAISNVGPGLGEIIGPAGSFAPLSASAKWLLSFAMLVGRLELFTILVLFTPSFWWR